MCRSYLQDSHYLWVPRDCLPLYEFHLWNSFSYGSSRTITCRTPGAKVINWFQISLRSSPGQQEGSFEWSLEKKHDHNHNHNYNCPPPGSNFNRWFILFYLIINLKCRGDLNFGIRYLVYLRPLCKHWHVCYCRLLIMSITSVIIRGPRRYNIILPTYLIHSSIDA